MTTISELTKILKPSKNCLFFDLCANFLREIKQAEKSGEVSYEIGSRYTKNGHPHTIQF